MKKFLLFFSVLGITGLTAQTPNSYNVLKKGVKQQTFAPQNFTGFEEIKGDVLVDEKSQVEVGKTTYDLQTNSSTNRNLLVGADGKLHATFTRSNTFDLGASDRGTGYNVYSNGAWGPAPTARIDGERTGWPQLFELGDGTIGVVAHTGASGSMVTKKAPGSTSWSSSIIPDDASSVWNRAAATGNTIHVVVARQNAFDGVDGAPVYRRSEDGGSTWTSPIIIPGFKEHYQSGSADSYAIAADGDVVAIVYGLYAAKTVLFKSLDGGDTWTSTVITDVVNPLTPSAENVDFVPTFCADGVTITLDSDKNVHVAFNTRFNIYDDAGSDGPDIYYLPDFSQNLMYWNESMSAPMHVGAAFRLDDNDGDGNNFLENDGNGYGGGLLTHPTIGRDQDDNLYITYDAALTDNDTDPGSDPDALAVFRDVFLVKSTDGGATWVGPYNVSNDPTTEAAFPVIPQVFTGDVPVLYQRDIYTGVAVQNTQPGGFVENSIQVDFVNPADINGADVDLTLNAPVIYTRWRGLGLDQGCDFDFVANGIYAFDYPDGQLPIEFVPLDGSTFDPSVPGAIDVFLSATDSDGNTTAVDTLTITIVEDVEAPVFDYTGSTDLQVFLNDSFTLPEINFTDNSLCINNAVVEVEGSVDTSTAGTYTVTYTVADFAGNVSEPLVFTVQVISEDTTAPVLTVNAQPTVTIESNVNSEFNCPTFTAFDSLDGDITENVVVTGCDAVDVNVPGTYVVTFEVSDASGNESSYTVTYTVQDTSSPTLSILAGQATQLLNCNATLPAITSLFAVIDNGSPQSINNFTVNQTGAVDVAANGTYPVVYTASDAAGNTSAAQTITYIVSGCSTGVQTVFGGVVSVLPNPTSGELFVDLSQTSVRSAVISIFDVEGRLLTEVQADNTAGAIRIDLSSFANGIYMVQINAGSLGIATDRVILTK